MWVAVPRSSSDSAAATAAATAQKVRGGDQAGQRGACVVVSNHLGGAGAYAMVMPASRYTASILRIAAREGWGEWGREGGA